MAPKIRPIIYREAIQQNRLFFFQKNYDEYFKSSTSLIEMGAHKGDQSFYLNKQYPNLSFRCEEGREYILKEGENRYKNFFWAQLDYEKINLEQLPSADIILNLGLFYHLSPSRAADILRTSIKRANKILFFETEVIDCDNRSFYKQHDGAIDKLDKALVPLEIRPSIMYIEDIFREFPYEWERIESSELNVDGNVYDWQPQNTEEYSIGFLRKFWVLKK